jgi:succinyl-diaminopimelate desuccinylase
MSETLALTEALIRLPSVTPADHGCQDLMIERLQRLGFQIERLRYGEVENFWARRGEGEPLFVFAGHTDVVPPGPGHAWTSDPFVPVVRDGYLYGRGAADMKASLAAMVVASERFVHSHPGHKGSIGFLITSDEEGDARDGTRRVMDHLASRHERIDWCLVGEPSSHERLGDTVKNGRRGSLHGLLTLQGLQGHVGYPHLARNPIHGAGPLITELTVETWDRGNQHFPPTTLQISNIRAGTGATNVVPGELEMMFNLRFGNESSATVLQSRIEEKVSRHCRNASLNGAHALDYRLDWRLSGSPFVTPRGVLVEATLGAIRERLGVEPELSTSGGTSDGRFIAPSGTQVVEFGPHNATIHKVNERVRVADLERLADLYQHLLERLLIA